LLTSGGTVVGCLDIKENGTVRKNAGVFSMRLRSFKEKFAAATGIPNLHEGTLNVWFDECVAIWPEFMIDGKELDNPDQDCLFESCKIIVDSRVYSGFRVRPYHRPTGGGGNGDKCMEIVAETIPGVAPGTDVTLEFTRDSRP
jgi:hypothetical protein